ncbi:MAG: hypothetical protein AB1762_07330 [Gemmatimonadota bacterium]
MSSTTDDFGDPSAAIAETVKVVRAAPERRGEVTRRRGPTHRWNARRFGRNTVLANPSLGGEAGVKAPSRNPGACRPRT